MRSYERGMVALTRAGGVEARVVQDANSASPVFLFDDIRAASGFAAALPVLLPDAARHAEATTRHGKLLAVDQPPGRPQGLRQLRVLDRRRQRHEHGGARHRERLRLAGRARRHRRLSSAHRPRFRETRERRRARGRQGQARDRRRLHSARGVARGAAHHRRADGGARGALGGRPHAGGRLRPQRPGRQLSGGGVHRLRPGRRERRQRRARRSPRWRRWATAISTRA